MHCFWKYFALKILHRNKFIKHYLKIFIRLNILVPFLLDFVKYSVNDPRLKHMYNLVGKNNIKYSKN